jgi:hypothetical protein
MDMGVIGMGMMMRVVMVVATSVIAMPRVGMMGMSPLPGFHPSSNQINQWFEYMLVHKPST